MYSYVEATNSKSVELSNCHVEASNCRHCLAILLIACRLTTVGHMTVRQICRGAGTPYFGFQISSFRFQISIWMSYVRIRNSEFGVWSLDFVVVLSSDEFRILISNFKFWMWMWRCRGYHYHGYCMLVEIRRIRSMHSCCYCLTV